MKKQFMYLMAVIFILTVSCHSKKKITESHKLEVTSTQQKADSSSKLSVTKTQKADSSKSEKADSSHTRKKEKIDIQFTFGKGQLRWPVPPLDSNARDHDFMDQLINQALANAETVQMHIEREQDDRRGSRSTEQKGSAEKTQTKEKSKEAHNQQSTDHIKKEDKQSHTETKPDYSWIVWLVAILAVLGTLLYITNRLRNKWPQL